MNNHPSYHVGATVRGRENLQALSRLLAKSEQSQSKQYEKREASRKRGDRS